MQGEGKQQLSATNRTRYVFAGSQDREQEDGVKTCPRCGQVLFEDMNVCFGCLYDFTRDHETSAHDGPVRAREASRAMPDRTNARDPLRGIDLDEIDDEELLLDESEPEMTRIPRHSKEYASAPGDTLDLTPVSNVINEQVDSEASCILVELSSPELRVRLPVPERGLTVGRDEASDVVLRSPAVSRRHMRLVSSSGKLTVEDLGATNPALFEGAPLRGTRDLAEGSEVTVGDVVFSLGKG